MPSGALTSAKRVHNFNAGPSALPLAVLERIREELLDWRGSGMSVMEMSHRSPEFEAINAAAEAGLRKHLAVPEDYAVLFLQGGGSTQFTQVPMNLALPGKPVDLLHTGAWTAKALAELKKGVPHRVAASTEAVRFTRVPRRNHECGVTIETGKAGSHRLDDRAFDCSFPVRGHLRRRSPRFKRGIHARQQIRDEVMQPCVEQVGRDQHAIRDLPFPTKLIAQVLLHIEIAIALRNHRNGCRIGEQLALRHVRKELPEW